MRLKLAMDDLPVPRPVLEKEFNDFATTLNIRWSVHYTDATQRVAILVTRAAHCLFDLLARRVEGEYECEVPVIISNHRDLKYVAEKFQIQYQYLPVDKSTKPWQEGEIHKLIDYYKIDLIVLARYMQILSKDFVDRYPGRIINIHHAFLPSFQGANPYLQAYDRGVKMIGATGHYVTADLDEGPIIEQGVERVTHALTPSDFAAIGRDIEAAVLARAVKMLWKRQAGKGRR
jgi:formyltetrahydrofolate deformylase